MKYSRLILLIFFALYIISCKQDPVKDSMAYLVRKWEGKQILYPFESIFTIYGEDTLSNYTKSGMDYSIVSYIDSLGCFSCKLQSKAWKDFINQVNSISNSVIPVNIFIHNGDVKELLSVLKKEEFEFPVCIDLNDSLRILNDFPTNLMFRTFLLDKDNKVVAIGNPIHNPQVKELYLKIIKGETIGKEDTSKQIVTKAAVDKSFIQMGSFNWQEEQKATFTLKNTGDKLLVIHDIVTSCGCTTVSYSKEPVRPDQEVTLEVAYKAEHPGYFDKTVTVYCNVEDSPLKLRINGNAQ